MVDTIFAGFLSMHVFEVLHGIIRYQLTPGAVVRKKVSFLLACLDVIRDLGTSVHTVHSSISAFGIQVMLRKPHCIPFPSSPTTLFRTKTTILLSIRKDQQLTQCVSIINIASKYRYRHLSLQDTSTCIQCSTSFSKYKWMDDFLGLDLWTRTGTERAKSSKYDLSSIFGPGFFVRLVFATTGLLSLFCNKLG